MGVGRYSRPLRVVGVLTMTDAGLDTMRCVESGVKVPLVSRVLRLLVACVAVGVFIDLC